MGRKRKTEDGVVCTVILPRTFLESRPSGMERSEWVRSNLPINGNAHANQIILSQSISNDQKSACKSFLVLFNKLLDAGLLDEFIDDGVIKSAEILEEMSK